MIRLIKELKAKNPFINFAYEDDEDDDELFAIKSYLYKDSLEYSREFEWRIITFDEQDTNYNFLPENNTLKAIYYGQDIDHSHKEYLSNIAKQKGIKEYDVLLDINSPHYNLKINEIK